MLLTVAEKAQNFFTSRAFEVIIISMLSMLVCQLYKFIYYSIKYKRAEWVMLSSTGGFPSSHTGFVVALTMSIGMFEMHDLGTIDYAFAVAFVFAFVTIHDAMGVRYEASKHAIILNNLVVNLSEEEREDLGFGKKGRLKEKLGHRFVEVLGGILFGIVVAIIGYLIVV